MSGMYSICRTDRRETKEDQGHARRDKKAFSESRCRSWSSMEVACQFIRSSCTYSCSVLRLSTRLFEAPTNTSEACNSRDEAALDRDTRGQKCLRESRLKGLANDRVLRREATLIASLSFNPFRVQFYFPFLPSFLFFLSELRVYDLKEQTK